METLSVKVKKYFIMIIYVCFPAVEMRKLPLYTKTAI